MVTDEPGELDDALIADLVGDGYVEGYELPQGLDSHVYDPDATSVERRDAEEGDFFSEHERELYLEAFDRAHDLVSDSVANSVSFVREFQSQFAQNLAAGMDRLVRNGTTQAPGDRVRVVRPEDLDGPLQGAEVESIILNECGDVPPALWQGFVDAVVGTPAIARNWPQHINCRCVVDEDARELRIEVDLPLVVPRTPIEELEAFVSAREAPVTTTFTTAGQSIGPYEEMTDEMREQLRFEMTERIAAGRRRPS